MKRSIPILFFLIVSAIATTPSAFAQVNFCGGGLGGVTLSFTNKTNSNQPGFPLVNSGTYNRLEISHTQGVRNNQAGPFGGSYAFDCPHPPGSHANNCQNGFNEPWELHQGTCFCATRLDLLVTPANSGPSKAVVNIFDDTVNQITHQDLLNLQNYPSTADPAWVASYAKFVNPNAPPFWANTLSAQTIVQLAPVSGASKGILTLRIPYNPGGPTGGTHTLESHSRVVPNNCLSIADAVWITYQP